MNIVDVISKHQHSIYIEPVALTTEIFLSIINDKESDPETLLSSFLLSSYNTPLKTTFNLFLISCDPTLSLSIPQHPFTIAQLYSFLVSFFDSYNITLTISPFIDASMSIYLETTDSTTFNNDLLRISVTFGHFLEHISSTNFQGSTHVFSKKTGQIVSEIMSNQRIFKIYDKKLGEFRTDSLPKSIHQSSILTHPLSSSHQANLIDLANSLEATNNSPFLLQIVFNPSLNLFFVQKITQITFIVPLNFDTKFSKTEFNSIVYSRIFESEILPLTASLVLKFNSEYFFYFAGRLFVKLPGKILKVGDDVINELFSSGVSTKIFTNHFVAQSIFESLPDASKWSNIFKKSVHNSEKLNDCDTLSVFDCYTEIVDYLNFRLFESSFAPLQILENFVQIFTSEVVPQIFDIIVTRAFIGETLVQNFRTKVFKLIDFPSKSLTINQSRIIELMNDLFSENSVENLETIRVLKLNSLKKFFVKISEEFDQSESDVQNLAKFLQSDAEFFKILNEYKKHFGHVHGENFDSNICIELIKPIENLKDKQDNTTNQINELSELLTSYHLIRSKSKISNYCNQIFKIRKYLAYRKHLSFLLDYLQFNLSLVASDCFDFLKISDENFIRSDVKYVKICEILDLARKSDSQVVASENEVSVNFAHETVDCVDGANISNIVESRKLNLSRYSDTFNLINVPKLINSKGGIIVS
ncbi:hypothetical protein RCL1_008133 [Eukaryota sp. TZLM3-RCL]